MEERIRDARRAITSNLSFLDDAFQVSRGYYHHGVGKSKEVYASLIDEKEQTSKVIAIACSGLIGLTVARRKGVFKKLFYTSAFGTAMASFCYPNKAKEYTDIVCFITKNKMAPLVKDYTGVDVAAQFKSLNDSLPDFSSLKKLWNEQMKSSPDSESPKSTSEKKK